MTSERQERAARGGERLSRLEHEVLQMFLASDDPRSAVLRQQLRLTTVARRELTGVGFFTYLAVPATAPRAPLGADEVRLTGVLAEMDGLEHGAGFVLYVDGSVLHMLEGYCYDEPWPQATGAFSLSYFDGKPPSLP